jgi:hypothetical protein
VALTMVFSAEQVLSTDSSGRWHRQDLARPLSFCEEEKLLRILGMYQLGS